RTPWLGVNLYVIDEMHSPSVCCFLTGKRSSMIKCTSPKKSFYTEKKGSLSDRNLIEGTSGSNFTS
ncbi:MAG: hypothetical protein KDD31_14220, partial [Muricauda sp.]|nr:hypothetical protein [Allomuricauda sp.]